MKRARFHTLLTPALVAMIAAGASCGGGTSACKQGTLFVTIVLNGTTVAADEIDVSVSVDGGPAKSARHPRTPGGTTETIEIDFPSVYPAGKRIAVAVTAYMGGAPIATKTETVASLADGCGTLTVTVEGGGSAGTGGMGGTGGGAAGRGGAGGSISGAAGRGGSSGGTGGGAAGRGGSGGTGTGSGTAGTGGGAAGRGGTGGGTAGRGGTGGGSAGTGGPPVCRFASFDTASESFILNPFNTDPGNLLFREAGPIATMTWTNAEGDPTAGSLKIDAPFSDYKQMVDVTSSFGGLRNLSGTRLHVRVKIASGLDQSVNSPPAVQPWANSNNSNGWKGNWANVIVGHAWADYILDLLPDGNFDPTQLTGIGVQIVAGDGLINGNPNPVKPTPAVIYVDSFWLEGACTGGMGGFPGGAGGTGGGCPGSDPAPSTLISDFSMMDAGTAVVPLGGPFVYGMPTSPTATVQNGAWHVTFASPGMAAPQYTGVGIFFNGPVNYMNCVSAASYMGVSFKIAGAVAGTGCTVGFGINDSEHGDSTADTSGKSSGPTGSFSPGIMLTPAQITTAGQTINVPFTGPGAPSGGSPMTAVDKTRLIGMSWSLNVPAGTANACNVDVTLDDVKFY